jgi:hypothetical protein
MHQEQKETPQTLQSGVGRLNLAELSLEILLEAFCFPHRAGYPLRHRGSPKLGCQTPSLRVTPDAIILISR